MGPLPREDWIEEFVRLMAAVESGLDASACRSLAEQRWTTASHRSPADAAQELLIERYLEAGQPPRHGVDLGDSAA